MRPIGPGHDSGVQPVSEINVDEWVSKFAHPIAQQFLLLEGATHVKSKCDGFLHEVL